MDLNGVVIEVVFRSCEGYSVKKSINTESRVYDLMEEILTSFGGSLRSAVDVCVRADDDEIYGIVNDAKNRETMIGKVLESYVKPFKRLSANFPRHDVEIQLEFQEPQHLSKIIQKRPIYRENHKKPKVHALHERGHSEVDYLAERNANGHYSIPSRTVEHLPFDNVAGHNTMDNFVSRGVIDNYGARKIIDRFGDSFGLHNAMNTFGNQNGMVNFHGHNDMSNLAGHNTAMDSFSSRNTMVNNAGYSAVNSFGGHNAMDSFAGHNNMNINNPGVYPMNHGVSNIIGQEKGHIAPMEPLKGKGVPPVARQAETESTTTEAVVTANNVNKGQSLSLEDIRKLFDEYAEKIISSKSGNEQQRSDNNQVPQVYIHDNNGNIDDSALSNLDQIANLIKKGVQVHKIDENNQESFLPKTGMNWMRIKVPV